MASAAAAVVLLDQLTKPWALNRLGRRAHRRRRVAPLQPGLQHGHRVQLGGRVEPRGRIVVLALVVVASLVARPSRPRSARPGGRRGRRQPARPAFRRGRAPRRAGRRLHRPAVVAGVQRRRRRHLHRRRPGGHRQLPRRPWTVTRHGDQVSPPPWPASASTGACDAHRHAAGPTAAWSAPGGCGSTAGVRTQGSARLEEDAVRRASTPAPPPTRRSPSPTWRRRHATTTWWWWTSPPGWWSTRAPATPRAPSSAACWPGSPRSPRWASAPGPASSTASTGGRRAARSSPARRRLRAAGRPAVRPAGSSGVPALVLGRRGRRPGRRPDRPVAPPADPHDGGGATGARPAPPTRSSATYRAGPVALVRCPLETGRTHQIRVHMKAIGHPVVGDDVRYGRADQRPRWPSSTGCSSMPPTSASPTRSRATTSLVDRPWRTPGGRPRGLKRAEHGRPARSVGSPARP